MLNHITVMGRLTCDPELQSVADANVCNFSLACDRDYKSKNGEKETDFIDVVAWRQTAEMVSRYFSKGRMAIVEGRLQIRNWTDRGGNKRRTAEIVADRVYFGDSKPKAEGEATTAGSDDFQLPKGFDMDNFADDDGELPF